MYKLVYSIWPYSEQRGEYFRMYRDYTLLERAREVYHMVASYPSPNRPMLIREETTYYSDIRTRKLSKFTQYTALL